MYKILYIALIITLNTQSFELKSNNIDLYKSLNIENKSQKCLGTKCESRRSTIDKSINNTTTHIITKETVGAENSNNKRVSIGGSINAKSVNFDNREYRKWKTQNDIKNLNKTQLNKTKNENIKQDIKNTTQQLQLQSEELDSIQDKIDSLRDYLENNPPMDGIDGEPFTYDDFTALQLVSLKGDKGDDGDDGRSIIGSRIDPNNHLIVSYSDNTSDDLGIVVGSDGVNGVGIQTANIDVNKHLILTKTNGDTIDAGLVIPNYHDKTTCVIDGSGHLVVDGSDLGRVIQRVPVSQSFDEINSAIVTNMSDGSTIETILPFDDYYSGHVEHGQVRINLRNEITSGVGFAFDTPYVNPPNCVASPIKSQTNITIVIHIYRVYNDHVEFRARLIGYSGTVSTDIQVVCVGD